MTTELSIRSDADLKLDILMAIARQRTNLDNFGPDHFIEPLSVLLRAMREEAQLSPSGLQAQSERLINSLQSRLLKTDFIESHPEVLDEEISVRAVINGLPRTGSTMFHRLLASTPSLTATYWWETIYPVPLSGEEKANPDQRVQLAKDLVTKILSAAENFDAIHPLDATAYDEELTLMEQSFVSNMPESMMYVPSYGKWLLQADQTIAYQELIDYLKILQWNWPKRRKQSWILKTPQHLTATSTILKLFPKAVFVMTHRPIMKVMPSWYSMVGALTEADSDAENSKLRQADHWTWRLKRNLQDMLQARKGAEERFLDIGYKQLLSDPVHASKQVFNKAGLTMSEQTSESLSTHLNRNKRTNRPSHVYNMVDYGMDTELIENEFLFYTKAFKEYL